MIPFRSRVAATTAIGAVWVLLLAYWLLTYAEGYEWWVNLGVVVLFMFIGNVMSRVLWPKGAPKGEMGTPEGLRIRAIVSAVTSIAWLVAVIAWWSIYGGDHGTYAVLGYILLSTLPLGAIMLVVWMSWLH